MSLPPSAPELVAKYDRPLPRYTSYPTAPQFHAGIDAATYGAWLAEVPSGAPLSIYLHVPFCSSLCWFCGCTTKVTNRYKPVTDYVDLLLREIDLIAERLGPGHPIAHLHFGGGSPSLLAAADIDRLFARLGARFGFSPGAEIAVEIDPRVLGAETLAAFVAGGLNRASIGVQDINPKVQRAINRIQPLAVTRGAVEHLRAAGVGAINLDLMYGLPHQSLAMVEATVAAALELAPERIALFGYAHVPHMKRHQRLIPEAALPGRDARFAQAQAAASQLVGAGYRRIGLDHFARPDDAMARGLAEGRLRRNFQGYTTDPTPVLLGLGVSAIGALPQGYLQNAADLPAYRAAVLAGRPATQRGVALDADDRRRRRVIERIMCDLEVDLDADPDVDPDLTPGDFAGERRALEALAADGLIELDGGRLRVTETGRPLLRVVAAVFDAYLRPEAARHSRAV